MITPDLVVHCNELASMSRLDAMKTYFIATWPGYRKSQFNRGNINGVELGDIGWGGRESFSPNGLRNRAYTRI